MAILKPGQLASGSYTISGSFSGSFQGSGAGLNNIPSSAIVGLSSSLDIGTTPIVSGTIGRVLFQGTGNVLQQSANLFWDNTNNRLGIGTSSPLSPLHIVGSSLGTGLIVNTGYAHLGTQTNPINTTLWNAALHISHTTDAALLFRTGPTFNLSTGIGQTTTGNLYIGWRNAGNPPINVFYSTGNVGINTTTDAGFRLDVNGDTIFRRITNVTPNTITGGTQFFTVKSGNWPTALIRCFENGNINLGSPTGNIGFDSTSFILPVSSTFNFNYLPANQLNTFAFILSANYTNVGAGGTSEGTMLRTSGSTSTSVGTVTMNQIESKPTYNNTGGTTINRGFYYNPILSSMTNTTHYAIHSTSGRVRLEGLPTSSTGLSAGDIWNDGGTLKIV
jgi:hypothetical protein